MERGRKPPFLMAKFFDYDPITGLTEYFDHDDQSGRSLIRTVEDVEPLLERNKALARDNLADGQNSDSFKLYASIPMTVVMELRKKGIDVFKKGHEEAVFKAIEQDYPYLKTTQKRMRPWLKKKIA